MGDAMTGPGLAALVPPCTIEAGGEVRPMTWVNKPGLAMFDADGQLQAIYALGDDGMYHLDRHAAAEIEAERNAPPAHCQIHVGGGQSIPGMRSPVRRAFRIEW